MAIARAMLGALRLSRKEDTVRLTASDERARTAGGTVGKAKQAAVPRSVDDTARGTGPEPEERSAAAGGGEGGSSRVVLQRRSETGVWHTCDTHDAGRCCKPDGEAAESDD